MLIFKRVEVDKLFSERGSENLGQKSVKSGFYSAITQVSKFFIGTISTITLARLLTPEDFGLIAMVSVFVNFASLFRDAGLSMATIQKEKIKSSEVSTLFWINVVISVILAVLLLIASTWIEAFYGRPEISSIVYIVAVTFIVSGISIQHKALLKRLLRFEIIGIIEICSLIAGLIVAVILALLDFSYMALVINGLASAFITTLLTIFFLPWIPSYKVDLKKSKKMLLFGGDITGFNFINYFSRNGDNLLIGKFLGSDELGVYSKAYSIFMMPVRQIRIPINSVSIPVLSKLKFEPERFRKYSSLIVEILALISLPITLICFFHSKFIINLMLGPGWEKAIPVFRILSLFGFVQIVLGIRGSIMISMGHTRKYLKVGIVYSICTIAAFIIGINFGIVGVALAFVVAQYLLFIPSLYYSFSGTPFSVSDFFNAVLPQFLIGFLTVGMHYLIFNLMDDFVAKNLISIATITILFIIVNYFRTDFRMNAKKIFKAIKV